MTDRFNDSLDNAAQYPKNLVQSRFYTDRLNAYFDRLTYREERLFLREHLANIGFWESDDVSSAAAVTQGFKPSTVTTLLDLTTKLQNAPPRCRFIFIHAKNSQAPLHINRPMLTYILTYLQAMPEFLDFLFPFGKQIYKEDFQFGGFRHETRLDEPSPLSLPHLQRSGRDLQVCYSLKSVEYSKTQPDCPWVIRQTAMYHTFDFVTGSMSWVCVRARAKNVIRKRIEEITGPCDSGCLDSATKSFALGLKIQLVLIDWTEENWRWYINYLEEELQRYTGLVSAAMVNFTPAASQEPLQRANNMPSTSLLRRQATRILQSGLQRARSFPLRRRTTLRPQPQQFPLGHMAPRQYESPPTVVDSEFQFQDLRGVQHIEERCYETQLVLKSNVETLEAMKQYYRKLVVTMSAAGTNNSTSQTSGLNLDSSRFETRVEEVINSMKIQLSRIDSLLLVLSNRKTLMLGILEHRNIEASKELAEKSQQSAQRMERMTEQMNEVALKTRKDTVSMKVITVVTLFFLPGTFISTLMSTDIVHFDGTGLPRSHMSFSPAALKLFLEVCLPMMLVTFLAWGFMYQWSVRYGSRAGHSQNESSSHANGRV